MKSLTRYFLVEINDDEGLQSLNEEYGGGLYCSDMIKEMLENDMELGVDPAAISVHHTLHQTLDIPGVRSFSTKFGLKEGHDGTNKILKDAHVYMEPISWLQEYNDQHDELMEAFEVKKITTVNDHNLVYHCKMVGYRFWFVFLNVKNDQDQRIHILRRAEGNNRELIESSA
ncbi:hypothetical protein D4R42_04465 [bacterium]|nr:MAG: hypothetical protein D4R42_04465 [bacterium]